MSALEDLLFLGTHGHVVAVNKATGRTMWQTSLPRTGYDIVSIVVENELLLCASAGRVFGLDGRTGEILWTNTLPGLGNSFVYLTTAQQNSDQEGASLLRAAAHAKAAQAASAGS